MTEYISKEVARRIIDSERSKEQMLQMLDNVPPSAQPEVIRCKDCEYGKQDEVGRWFCRGFGCQVGNEDGSGFCANAERRTNE